MLSLTTKPTDHNSYYFIVLFIPLTIMSINSGESFLSYNIWNSKRSLQLLYITIDTN